METSLTVNGVSISLESTFLGTKQADWSTPQFRNANNHKVTVETEFGRASFEFWASIASPKIQTQSDLIGAFECFVSDALIAEESFDDFCANFGYENGQGKRTYKACQQSNAKLKRIIGDVDIYDFANALQEIAETV